MRHEFQDGIGRVEREAQHPRRALEALAEGTVGRVHPFPRPFDCFHEVPRDGRLAGRMPGRDEPDFVTSRAVVPRAERADIDHVLVTGPQPADGVPEWRAPETSGEAVARVSLDEAEFRCQISRPTEDTLTLLLDRGR